MNIVMEMLSAMLNWLVNVVIDILKPYAPSLLGFIEWLIQGGPGKASGEIA